MSIEANDADRFPLLGTAGRAMLRRLREHPHAPIFRNASGHRLRAGELAQARAFEREVADAKMTNDAQAEWLPQFLGRCAKLVPHHARAARALPDGADPLQLASWPTTSRVDLSRDIAAFVPDDLPLDRLIQFSTSGTSGHPLRVPSHPLVAASYLAFHKRALRRIGIELEAGGGEVGVALVGWQKRCFTYASVLPLMNEAGLVKLNLHPDDWRDPEDRVRYLDDLRPELLSGDPISLSVLMTLPLRHLPRALLSTSMALTAGLCEALQARFRCPVLDLYSLNEAGPVAVFDAGLGGHLLLQHRLVVEVVDVAGRRVAPGQRGEITLTGGFNAWLPLLRYRTGDHAALNGTAEGPVLMGLVGRPPVRFVTQAGEWINNLDVTHALAAFALPRYALHQTGSGRMQLRVPASALNLAEPARDALKRLFGAEQPVDITALQVDDKVVQYTSEFTQTGAESPS